MKVLLLTGLGALFFTYYWDDHFDPASLQGARVLLTGASAGVGEELAYHYARLGSHLVLTAHTEALLQKVVGNCRKLGAAKIFYFAADMASPQAPGQVVQFALDKLGEPAELRAADFAGAAQPDRQPGLARGGLLAARPRALLLLRPLLGGQVRPGRLLRLPAAGAGRAGRERGHHRVCPGPPGPRLGRRGRQGRHEGQGGPGPQGGPGRDPRRRHASARRLLPVAPAPAGPAAGLAAALAGLVHPPGAQRLGRRCRLSPGAASGEVAAAHETVVQGRDARERPGLRAWECQARAVLPPCVQRREPGLRAARGPAPPGALSGVSGIPGAPRRPTPRGRGPCSGLDAAPGFIIKASSLASVLDFFSASHPLAPGGGKGGFCGWGRGRWGHGGRGVGRGGEAQAL
ncbi:hydroxysteroid 11-beta-dehydrogenase 1-like protein isoform X1 [Oryctolagus cuniculus]|uniref:hydroxysteroid 11-beta-dehydrogenase 1-like protein isoform X1 n=1 Tax=Oryctolagus cuniculus TaxID=9986 RepID=UPI0038790926